jgi:uncharacterized protein (TIGR02466 family)
VTGTTTELLFATRIRRSEPPELADLLPELEASCLSAAEDDRAGRAWSRKHAYPGYTSYASLDDLPWRFPAVKALVRVLDREAKAFAKDLAWDLGRGKLALAGIWINVLEPGGVHSGHVHPNSVISGTAYVAVPEGASAIRFEDPRLAMMMAAPPRKPKAERALQPFVPVAPAPGTVLLWESWLRHEVPANRAQSPRVSISFNYGWG